MEENVGFSSGKDGGGFPSSEDGERLSFDKRFSSDEICEGPLKFLNYLLLMWFSLHVLAERFVEKANLSIFAPRS